MNEYDQKPRWVDQKTRNQAFGLMPKEAQHWFLLGIALEKKFRTVILEEYKGTVPPEQEEQIVNEILETGSVRAAFILQNQLEQVLVSMNGTKKEI